MTELSDTELKVLRYIAKWAYVDLGGRGQVTVVAAARRLERKGLVYKSAKWGATQAGRDYLKEHDAQTRA